MVRGGPSTSRVTRTTSLNTSYWAEKRTAASTRPWRLPQCGPKSIFGGDAVRCFGCAFLFRCNAHPCDTGSSQGRRLATITRYGGPSCCSYQGAREVIDALGVYGRDVTYGFRTICRTYKVRLLSELNSTQPLGACVYPSYRETEVGSMVRHSSLNIGKYTNIEGLSP